MKEVYVSPVMETVEFGNDVLTASGWFFMNSTDSKPTYCPAVSASPNSPNYNDPTIRP